MSLELDVLVAGEVYIDLILSNFDIWPRLGQEAFAKEFRCAAGGGTAITACGLARLGLHTGVLARVGAQDGEWLLERLRGCGVDISRIDTDDTEPTGFTVVATMQTDRAFLTYRGANSRFEEYLRMAADSGVLSNIRHVHLGYAPDLAAGRSMMKLIQANGCTVSVDMGWNEAWLGDDRAMDVLNQVDVFFPNEAEASRLTGQTEPQRMLEVFAKAGVRRVVLKLGSGGCAMLWDGLITFEQPVSVTPVDTTGAGDCFDAGFLYAWLTGYEPRVCLQAANICGALSTEAYGGLDGFPTREVLEDRLR